jgi:phospholipid transport system substrate-binding protein
MRFHCFRVGAALLIAAAVVAGPTLLSGGRAWAGTPTGEVRGFLARAVSIAENIELAPRERLDSVHRMLADAFDFRSAAELALGQHWRARTPAERREFVPLFADLLERSYLSQVRARVKLDGGVRIDYLGETVKGNYATVQTVVRREGREDVPFDYRMIRRGTRWLVRDVVVDGVSLVENYRAQFAKTIEGSSFRQLIVTMKTGEPAR